MHFEKIKFTNDLNQKYAAHFIFAPSNYINIVTYGIPILAKLKDTMCRYSVKSLNNLSYVVYYIFYDFIMYSIKKKPFYVKIVNQSNLSDMMIIIEKSLISLMTNKNIKFNNDKLKKLFRIGLSGYRIHR